jgi:hypothetical protein
MATSSAGFELGAWDVCELTIPPPGHQPPAGPDLGCARGHWEPLDVLCNKAQFRWLGGRCDQTRPDTLDARTLPLLAVIFKAVAEEI